MEGNNRIFKKPPEKLQELIDLVNVLPLDVELLDYSEVTKLINLEDFSAKSSEEKIYQWYKKRNEVWFEQVKSMPELRDYERLFKFITTLRFDLDPNRRTNVEGDVFNGYLRFKQIREFFRKILERAKQHELDFEKIGAGIYSWQQISPHDYIDLGFVTLFADGEFGVISFEIPEILKPFEGCELVRFKTCAVCEKVFYASKVFKSQKTEPQSCGDDVCAKTLYDWKRLAEKQGVELDIESRRLKRKKKNSPPNQKKRKTAEQRRQEDHEKERRRRGFEASGKPFCPECVQSRCKCE